MIIERLNFTHHGDAMGKLLPIEYDDIPFVVRRTYIITETSEGIIRGKHAHYNLEQIIICLKGEVEIVLDDGNKQSTFALKGLGEAVRIKGIVWRELQRFSSDCVLMILASQNYDESDYIRCYEKFLSLVR